MTHALALALLALILVMVGCAQPQRPSTHADARRWSIALHGGAGFIPEDLPDEQRRAYLDSLEAVLRLGADMLERNGSALDTVEAVVRALEDDPLYNAGRGGVFAADGTVIHDASIMDGRDRSAGATTGTTTIKHPITLAHRVMTDSRYVLLSGDGAEAFADLHADIQRVDNSYFHTPDRRNDLERALERRRQRDLGSTVGAVALDTNGDLAAATSTGGLTAKLWGRVGDSPIIGAGTWADNATVAVSSTGAGEFFIRNAVAHEIHALVEHAGLSVREAARRVVFDQLEEGQGGVICVGADGSVAIMFNTPSMPFGRAHADGGTEVGIWQAQADMSRRD